MWRTYTTVPRGTSGVRAALPCPVTGCNRKYKTNETLIKHVERLHPFDTVHRHHCALSHEQRCLIYILAAGYLRKVLAGGDALDECAERLQPMPAPEVDIVLAQRQFAERLATRGTLAGCSWALVMRDFDRFLQMGVPHYDTNLCPTLYVDLLWHATMQDPALYAAVSRGHPLPHCARERGAEEDLCRFDYYCNLYEHRYHTQPHIPLPGPGSNEGACAMLLELATVERQLAQEEAAAELAKAALVAKRRQEAAIATVRRAQEQSRQRQEQGRLRQEAIAASLGRRGPFCKDAGIIPPLDGTWVQQEELYRACFEGGYSGLELVARVAHRMAERNKLRRQAEELARGVKRRESASSC